MGDRVSERTTSTAEQGKVPVIWDDTTLEVTRRKYLRARCIWGRETMGMTFHHVRHHRPNAATNASKMDGSITQNVN